MGMQSARQILVQCLVLALWFNLTLPLATVSTPDSTSDIEPRTICTPYGVKLLLPQQQLDGTFSYAKALDCSFGAPAQHSDDVAFVATLEQAVFYPAIAQIVGINSSVPVSAEIYYPAAPRAPPTHS